MRVAGGERRDRGPAPKPPLSLTLARRAGWVEPRAESGSGLRFQAGVGGWGNGWSMGGGGGGGGAPPPPRGGGGGQGIGIVLGFFFLFSKYVLFFGHV